MDKFKASYFSKVRHNLKILGLNLSQNVNNYDRVAVCVVPFFLCLFSGMVLFGKWNVYDPKDILYAIALATGIPHIIIIRFHRANLTNLLDLLESYCIDGVTNRPQIQTKLKGLADRFSKISTTLVLATMGLSILTWSLVEGTSQIPYNSMPNWALNYSFTGCIVFEIAVYFVMVHEYLAVDGLKLCILLQVKFHFKCLRMTFKHILKSAKQQFCDDNGVENTTISNDKIPRRYLQVQLKRVVPCHGSLHAICNEIERVFNKCVLASFVTISLLMCITLFNATRVSINSAERNAALFYFGMSWIVTFGDYYFVQMVITESEKLADSWYDVDFTGTDLRFQKALVILIANAQRPVVFTIGKFSHYSMATFVTITKAAYSYYMFLKSVKEI